MRRITVLIASALINASTIAGLAAECMLNKDVDGARSVSTNIQSKSANVADNEKTCRAYAASRYEPAMLRQAAGGQVDGAPVLTALDSVINAFNDLLGTECGD
jgi:hypothetical protein